MDTSKLKPFAQDARRILKAQVSARLDQVLAEQSAARREQPKAVSELETEIAKSDREQVIEKVAYTWFNRFTALRFMDANGYTRIKVVSPAEGQTRPEILAEAAAGNIDEYAPGDVRNKVAALLDGRTPSRDPQGEAYRLLLVAACNQWHSAMSFMFEKIADYTELLMPEDLLSADSILAKARVVMTEETCQDVEVIGWLYQFYISEKKDEVFAGLKKSKKITAENIPAATQLFTPHWIVRYLVENSLGRLWLLNRPSSKLAAKMDYYIAPEEPEADFIRISRPEEIRICDPACGSGHMLTYAFDLLYAIYEEEGYEATEIPELILTHNLHGIEIDDRAGALAAFALVMKAANKLGRRRLLRQAVQPNICVLQEVRFTASEMQDVASVAGSDLFTAEFRETMGQFEQTKNFGSLIVPKLREPAEVAQFVRLKDLGGDLLLRELQERVVKVLNMADALSKKYHVVVANPPYMGSKGMNESLKQMLSQKYKNGKSDLMTAFVYRGLDLIVERGVAAFVTLDGWMFLSSYEKFREDILESVSMSSMAHVGWNCFPDGHVYNRGTAFVLTKGHQSSGIFINLSDVPAVVDKRELFLERKSASASRHIKTKRDFEAIPGKTIAYWLSSALLEAFNNGLRAANVCEAKKGLTTGDNERYIRFWYELSRCKIGIGISGKYFPHAKGGEKRKWYGNHLYVLEFDSTARDRMSKLKGHRPDGISYFGKEGLTWGDVTSGGLSVRVLPEGFTFNNASPSAFFKHEVQRLCVLSLLNSNLGQIILDAINPTIHFNPGDFESFPLIGMEDENIYKNAQEAILIAKTDWDQAELSWDFAEFPLLKNADSQYSISDNYEKIWRKWSQDIHRMFEIEKRNNNIIINNYRLSGEVDIEPDVSDITLNCNPAFRYGGDCDKALAESLFRSDIIKDFISYAVGCMFGRYSLNAPGLILANQGEGLAEYLARVPEPTFEPDADNVIPVLDGDWFADDIVERFRKFLRVTFGEAKFQENLAFIEGALGKDIRKWFTRDFNDYHVRRYKKRPIYWMFSSPKGSFQALIYMHRYRPDTVSVVLNDYLREYRNKLEAHRKSLESLSSSANASPAQRTKAEKEIGEVTKVIAELDAYERDVLFPLATQKIEIDLDDGVKANYPKFGDALKPIKGLSDADD